MALSDEQREELKAAGRRLAATAPPASEETIRRVRAALWPTRTPRPRPQKEVADGQEG